MARSLGELAVQFGCELAGDPNVSVSAVATLANAGEGHLSFFANKAYRGQLRETNAAVVVLQPQDLDDCPVAALLTDNPYLVYAMIARELHPQSSIQPGSHRSAAISDSANVSSEAQISANVSIGDEAVIGARVFVGPGAVVGPRCQVGNDSQVLANATLVQDVVLGERCIIHSGAVIGADGFGNAQTDSGWVKVPQVGGVTIGDDVEIGACTSVDRGAIDDTVVETGVRIDNQIQIGHNVRIGEHTAIAASTAISGSTTIGKRCLIGGHTGLAGHLDICDDVVIAGGTSIIKNIVEPGYYMGLWPGEKGANWKKKVVRFRRIEDLMDRVSELEKIVRKDSE